MLLEGPRARTARTARRLIYDDLMLPMGDAHGGAPSCCPYYHAAVELLGRRWAGAIVDVLLLGGPLRFGEIAAAIPQLSDRLLSQRLKDLEAAGIVERVDAPGPPPHARYGLTAKGRGLAPAVAELKRWGRDWLDTSDITFRPA